MKIAILSLFALFSVISVALGMGYGYGGYSYVPVGVAPGYGGGGGGGFGGGNGAFFALIGFLFLIMILFGTNGSFNGFNG